MSKYIVSVPLFLLLVFGFVPVIILFNAWTITMLWKWFVIPGFHAQPLSMSVAFGLSVLIGMFTNNKTYSEVKDKKELTTAIGQLIGKLFGPLLMGYIGSFFV